MARQGQSALDRKAQGYHTDITWRSREAKRRVGYWLPRFWILRSAQQAAGLLFCLADICRSRGEKLNKLKKTYNELRYTLSKIVHLPASNRSGTQYKSDGSIYVVSKLCVFHVTGGRHFVKQSMKSIQQFSPPQLVTQMSSFGIISAERTMWVWHRAFIVLISKVLPSIWHKDSGWNSSQP